MHSEFPYASASSFIMFSVTCRSPMAHRGSGPVHSCPLMSTPTSSRLQSSTCERFLAKFRWICRFSHTKWYKMDENGTYMTSRCLIQTEIPKIAIHEGWESSKRLPTTQTHTTWSFRLAISSSKPFVDASKLVDSATELMSQDLYQPPTVISLLSRSEASSEVQKVCQS